MTFAPAAALTKSGSTSPIQNAMFGKVKNGVYRVQQKARQVYVKQLIFIKLQSSLANGFGLRRAV